MESREVDFRTFAHLRGKKEKSNSLKGLLVSGILLLAGLFLLMGSLRWNNLGF